MSSQENIALAKQGFDAFTRGDLEGVLALVGDDAEVFTPEDLPNAGRFVGRDGYLRWIGGWLEVWETFEVEPLDFEAIGERHVLVPAHQRGVGKGSGVEVEMDVCYMVEVRDGALVRLHFYDERGRALAAARAEESG